MASHIAAAMKAILAEIRGHYPPEKTKIFLMALLPRGLMFSVNKVTMLKLGQPSRHVFGARIISYRLDLKIIILMLWLRQQKEQTRFLLTRKSNHSILGHLSRQTVLVVVVMTDSYSLRCHVLLMLSPRCLLHCSGRPRGLGDLLANSRNS